MITRHRVQLNGTQLDSLDDRILIQEVDEPADKMTVKTASRGGRYGGQNVGTMARERKDVVITFGIAVRARDDWADREEIFDKIMGWARDGGILVTNEHEGKRLLVKCTATPDYIDPAKWADNYKITFTAFEVPYWEDVAATTVTEEGATSVTRQLTVKGSVGTRLEFNALNDSGAVINTLKLTAGAEFFEFAGLGLADGESLLVDHDNEDRLRIRIEGAGGMRSAMDKRTGTSSDELYVNPGTVSVTFTASGACDIEVLWRGRYL